MRNVPRLVPSWTKPIVIGRHAYRRPVPGNRLRRAGRGQAHRHVHPGGRQRSRWSSTCSTFPGGGVAMTMYNLDESIRDFARASFRYGLERGYPVYLSTKNTILKAYDGRFKDLFAEVFESEVQGRVRSGRNHLRAPPDRRHGGGRAQVGGRLRLGVQELRRRRAVRHGRAGIRLARPDDERADDSRRAHRRGRGGARHGHPALSPAPGGQADLDEPDRVDLRLDARARAPRQARQHARRSPSSPRPSSGSASRRSSAGR